MTAIGAFLSFARAAVTGSGLRAVALAPNLALLPLN